MSDYIKWLPAEEAERVAAGPSPCEPNTGCPLCDLDRAKHADDCPADILRQLGERVAEQTGLTFDTTGWEDLLDDLERKQPDRVALCIAPHGMSLAAQIAALYDSHGVLLLPIEMAPGDAEARMAELAAVPTDDLMERLFKDEPRELVYKCRPARDMYDVEPMCAPEPEDHRQSYLRLNQAPNRYRAGNRGGHKRKQRR